jgi:alkaline phosphatase D
VVSGETTATSTVLWTSTTVAGNVCFEYATDPKFENIRGLATVPVSTPSMPVTVQLSYLVPDTRYYYRITDATGTVATGTFSTSSPTDS